MGDFKRNGKERRTDSLNTHQEQRSGEDRRSMNGKYFQIIKILKKIPIFEGLTDSHFKQILRICAQKIYKQGEYLFWEGDESDRMFILIKGELKVTFLDGTELSRIEPVGIVGEMGIFTDEMRSASAEAVEDSILLVFHKKELFKIFKFDCVLAVHILMNVIKDLSHKLKKNNIVIEELREIDTHGNIPMISPEDLLGEIDI